MRNPGSAGLTVDRWGDSEPWQGMPRKESECTLAENEAVEQARKEQNGDNA